MDTTKLINFYNSITNTESAKHRFVLNGITDTKKLVWSSAKSKKKNTTHLARVSSSLIISYNETI